MIVGQRERAVGIFPRFEQMAEALKQLKESGFPIEHISVIGKQRQYLSQLDPAVRTTEVGNQAEKGAKRGAIAGGLIGLFTGFFVGIGLLAIPAIGPIMLAGAAETAFATTLAGGAIGLATGTLLGALIGLGIPEEKARVYQERIQRGEFLMIVDGTEYEIRHARSILIPLGIEDWGVYDAPTDEPAYATNNGRVVARR